MKHDHEQPSPVSFRVNVARLPQKGMLVEIRANEVERAALAEAHGLLSVESFEADLSVSKWNRNGIRVEGTVRAAITQACVVTLEPLAAVIDEPVEGLFLPEDSKLGREGFETGGEIMLDYDGLDSPETFTGDTIDAGALAEQFFGLAIDPYPRKGGVAVQAEEGATEAPRADWQEKLSALQRKG